MRWRLVLLCAVLLGSLTFFARSLPQRQPTQQHGMPPRTFTASVAWKGERVALSADVRTPLTWTPGLRVSHGERSVFVELPNEGQRLTGTIQNLRAVPYLGGIAVALHMGTEEGDFGSFYVATLGQRVPGEELQLEGLEFHLFSQLLIYAGGLELGDIAAPESDSIVVTLYSPQPVPGTNRHELFVFRNDCPAFPESPFPMKREFPRAGDLSWTSRSRTTSARPRQTQLAQP
jgi:hypothetical protein